jgi:hypothetical protein
MNNRYNSRYRVSTYKPVKKKKYEYTLFDLKRIEDKTMFEKRRASNRRKNKAARIARRKNR